MQIEGRCVAGWGNRNGGTACPPGGRLAGARSPFINGRVRVLSAEIAAQVDWLVCGRGDNRYAPTGATCQQAGIGGTSADERAKYFPIFNLRCQPIIHDIRYNIITVSDINIQGISKWRSLLRMNR